MLNGSLQLVNRKLNYIGKKENKMRSGSEMNCRLASSKFQDFENTD